MRSTFRPDIKWNMNDSCYEVQIGNGLYAEIFQGGIQVRKQDHNLVFDTSTIIRN